MRRLAIVLAAIACGPTMRSKAPRTVEEAVSQLQTKWLDSTARDLLLRNPREAAVGSLYMPFGTAVRNEWGLWHGNAELRRSCGTTDPEACSVVIFERLWDALRAGADPVLVKSLDCQFAVRRQVQVRYGGFDTLRMGDMLQSVQSQIDSQAARLASALPSGCEGALKFQLVGNPDLQCWVRAEFARDGKDPISLDRFFGWISWRNGFDTRHAPPYLELRFREPCAWRERPTQFG